MTDTYICIDLETTGLNPKMDKIIEIGAVKVIDGKVTDTFSTIVNPGRILEERVSELTGITNDKLENAPYIEDILPALEDFLEDLPLLGHRILFDYSFLKKAMVTNKRSFERKGIDTLRIARRFLPSLEHRTLEFLCKHYGIPHTAHRALEDAKATSELYQILAKDFYNEEEPCFKLQPLVYQVKKETPITKPQKERLYRLLEKHGITPDYDVEKLTRSEASRHTDKILAKYGR